MRAFVLRDRGSSYSRTAEIQSSPLPVPCQYRFRNFASGCSGKHFSGPLALPFMRAHFVLLLRYSGVATSRQNGAQSKSSQGSLAPPWGPQKVLLAAARSTFGAHGSPRALLGPSMGTWKSASGCSQEHFWSTCPVLDRSL